MDTHSTAAIGRYTRRRAAKTITLISVVTCLAVTGFAAAVYGFTEAPATQPVTATTGDEVPGPSATAPADNGAVPADNTPAPAPMPASSAARTIGRLSMPITSPTATRRSGSPTANSTSALRRRLPTWGRSTPMVSIRPTIRCRTSPRLSAILPHWRKPKCGSPRRL
jgi:hypothetical protein